MDIINHLNVKYKSLNFGMNIINHLNVKFWVSLIYLAKFLVYIIMQFIQ